jgi:predicted RecB family endonuclease
MDAQMQTILEMLRSQAAKQDEQAAKQDDIVARLDEQETRIEAATGSPRKRVWRRAEAERPQDFLSGG